jgi:uncharacterized protein
MKLAIICLALALAPASAGAQSFNCRFARTADEILICQNRALARLDERMSELYFRARNSLYGGQRRQLEADQAKWLRSRHGCGRDASCIEDSYLQRIRELRDY